MSEISITRYQAQHQSIWDDFVATAKNGTFMLHRAFIDYHQERFQDHSVLLWKGSRLLAVFPANIVSQVWYSHQGLSYAGLIWSRSVGIEEVCNCWKALLQYALTIGIDIIDYKPVPSYYHQWPSGEDLQVLFWLQASLTAVESSVLVKGHQPAQWQARRRRGLKQAMKNNLSIDENKGLADFWEILSENLYQNHRVKPVHTFEEIQYLQNQFPKNIRLITIRSKQEILGGCLLFEANNIAHIQYIGSNEAGKSLHALDLLCDKVFWKYKDWAYTSLGVSSLRITQQINKGLQDWKESWGGTGGAHEHWQIQPLSWGNLEGRFV